MMMRGGREAQLFLLVALSLSFLAPHAVVGVKNRKGGGGDGGGNGADCPGLGSGGSLSERLAKAEQLMKSDIAGAMACAVHSQASGGRDEKRRAELLFAIAATAHSRRMFDKAMECMSAIPEAALADWGQGNHLIGVLKLHLNNAAGAIRSLRIASELMPTDALIYTALAQAHYDTNDPQGAVGVWERGCGNMPSHADGFFNVGILLRELGTRLEDSARSYRTAIRLSPQTSRYRYSYGNLMYDVGLLNAASSVYRGALRIDPGHEDASNNLGNALRQGGKLGEARAVFEAGIRLNPGNTNLLLNSGQVYQDLGLIDKVEEVAKKAFSISPGVMEASLLLGSVSYLRGDLNQAADHYRKAHSAAPNAQQPLLNLANTLGDLYRQMEARMSNQNEAMRSEMKAIHGESISAYEALLRNNPDDAEAFMHMMWARKYACDWQGWVGKMERMVALIETQISQGRTPPIKPFLALAFPISASLYIAIAEAHASAEEKKAAQLLLLMQPLPPPRRLLPSNRITLAYMSTDLGDHPVGHQAWFWAHDQTRFDVVLFALSENDDSSWWRNNSGMVPTGNFVELGRPGSGISPGDLAERINRRNVHILVTLNGWTSGNQIDSLAMRPAALQVEYMGSHDSTGGHFMDLFISDRIATPPEYGTPFFSEKMSLLPHSFFMNEYANSRAHIHPRAGQVFAGRDRGDEKGEGKISRESAGLPSDGMLMCNFNQLFKVDPEVFQVWMNILSSVRDSYLWLLRLPSTAEANMRNTARASHGEQVEKRILFSERIDWKTHLLVKSMANISLDNPVFNSHTSGVDILWSGVPLLTLPRETMSSRVAASLISATTLPLTIARDMSDYQALAERFVGGGEPGRAALRRTRDRLASDRMTAPLFDTRRMTVEFEKSLLMAWESREANDWKGSQLSSHVIVSDNLKR